MEFKKIKDCFPVIRNGATVKQDKSSGGIPITRIESINENKLDKDKLGFAGINDDTFKDFYLEDGDILMSHINSVSHLGKVAVFENRNDKIIHGMNLLCLKADKNIVIPNYAFYYFRSPLFINNLKKITKKSVNQASFNISSLGSLKFPLPEKIQDQQRIATILSKAEALIAQRKQSIALLDEYLRSTFLDMFGDPVRNEKGWEVVKLGNHIKAIIAGTSYSGVDKGFLEENELGVIKTSAVTWGTFNPKEYKAVSKELINKEIINPLKGDLLFSRANTRELVGATCIVLDNYPNLFLPDKIWKLELDEEVLTKYYLYYLLQDFRFKKSLTKDATGSHGSMLNISMDKLRQLKCPLPPLTLQNQFAAIVQKVEELKKQYRQSLGQLEALFGSLGQRGFKGELNLKGNSDFKFSPALQRDIEVPPRIKIVKKKESTTESLQENISDLLTEHNAGNKKATALLYNITKQNVYSKLKKTQVNRLVNYEDYEDAFQESFVKALETTQKIINKDAFIYYTYVIVRNTLFANFKKGSILTKGGKLMDEKDFEKYQDELEEFYFPDQPNYQLENLIKTLPEDGQELLNLLIEGYTVAEISKTLDIPKYTVQRKLTALKKALITKQKEKGKVEWENISTETIASWINDTYQGFCFNIEMLMNTLKEEYVTFINYFSSEELKQNPFLNEQDDIRWFIEAAVSGKNPFMQLHQFFYNAEEENEELLLRKEDYELIEKKPTKSRSGIYFKIKSVSLLQNKNKDYQALLYS